jgi:hypothetical protein
MPNADGTASGLYISDAYHTPAVDEEEIYIRGRR